MLFFRKLKNMEPGDTSAAMEFRPDADMLSAICDMVEMALPKEVWGFQVSLEVRADYVLPVSESDE